MVCKFFVNCYLVKFFFVFKFIVYLKWVFFFEVKISVVSCGFCGGKNIIRFVWWVIF